MDLSRVANGTSQAVSSRKRSQNTTSASDSPRIKKPRLQIHRRHRLSNAERTLVQGAAHIWGLTIDQLICAVDRYQASQIQATKDHNDGSSDTPSISSGLDGLRDPSLSRQGMVDQVSRRSHSLDVPEQAYRDLKAPAEFDHGNLTAHRREPATSEPDTISEKHIRADLDFYLERQRLSYQDQTTLTFTQALSRDVQSSLRNEANTTMTVSSNMPISMPLDVADQNSIQVTSQLPIYFAENQARTQAPDSLWHVTTTSHMIQDLGQSPISSDLGGRSTSVSLEEQTRLVRDLKACIRCRMQRTKASLVLDTLPTEVRRLTKSSAR
jgi:hypothetical protein